jgi:hypothetical protein
MAQKTNLNIGPYYDDFDKDKDFYKVLFKPGYPVQARELTTLQSILQNQVESFGKNIIKEGSMVLPGSVTFDNQFSAVKLNASNLGVDVSVYINNFIGKKITGQLSGVTATIQYVAFTSESNDVDNLTIYVNYLESGDDSETDVFQDGESLFASENVVYGNTVINAGTPFASLVSQDATSIGSAASVDSGVYFIRGTFVNVTKQTIILDYYTNTPSYRVGFKVSETFVSAKDDSSLYDNAKGFTNFAAPGADRLKISLTLTKKVLSDTTDTDFVEILRVDDGKIKKIENKPTYNLIRDYIAERTFDESGHYALDEFQIKALNSLNDEIDNDGLYLEGETTEQGNIPSDDLMCLQVSPGRAYVDGYDVTIDGETAIDVEKPRDTEKVENANIPFEMGSLLRVNNVSGVPRENRIVELHSQLGSSPTSNVIGVARVYTFNLTDSAYSNASSQWDLYLYDVQTYTNVVFNRNVTAIEIPSTSFIKGKSSGATGFVVAGASANNLNLRQTSGTFVSGEKLIVNGNEISLTVKSFTANKIDQIKSVSMSDTQAGFPSNDNFTADAVLYSKKFSNGINEVVISDSGTTVKSPGKLFSGVKINDILSVTEGGDDPKYARVTGVSSDLSTLTITNIISVSGVFDGTAINNGNYSANLRIGKLRNTERSYLYAELPESNISSINLSGSNLLITQQISPESTNVNGDMTFSVPSGIASSFYETFDQERYSVHYDGGGIGTVTSDAFTLTGGGTGVEIKGLNTGQSNIVVNTTLKKVGIQSKVKNFTRSALKFVNLSKLVESGPVGSGTSNSINDGLVYNKYYGLRVQDDNISLDVPDVSKVLAVYESTNTLDPTLDSIEFSSTSNVLNNAVIGENIVGSDSGAVARIVTNNNSSPSSGGTNKLGIVYLNENTFQLGETVRFKESNVISTVQSITLGKYNNITNNFVLDGGQKDEYYDYSRLIRTTDLEPSRRLLVVYDHYVVPATDSGDVFTILSYDSDRFLSDIPSIGKRGVRASDTLDFRPRVANNSSTTRSPFDFDSRLFTTNYNLKPGESSLVGFDFYLPRIDKLYLDKFENLIVSKGVSAKDPKASPSNDQSLMELATIILPPYLYNPDNVGIELVDNRRYTMRDIGKLEDRIENLERTTSLSLLEVSTESLRVEDAEGNNRFKSGFFVDDFRDFSACDGDLTFGDISEGTLRPRTFVNTLQQRLIPSSEIPSDELDLTSNFQLLDPNVQKTGNVVTLKYNSIDWLEQPLATQVENVNPFHVVEYVGNVKLSPESDFWIRTIYIPPSVTNISRSFTNVINNTINNTVTIPLQQNVPFARGGRAGGRAVGIGIEFNTSVSSSVSTSTSSRTRVDVRSRDVLISSGDEQYIRSRNVSFFARTLKPLTKHYQFLDNHSNVDVIPKLLEIANSSTLENYGSTNGTFQKGETIKVYKNGSIIGTFRLASSNHKEGKFNSPSRTYNINPYVRSENISSGYSQSSKVLNIDLNSLSAEAQGNFFGRVEKGAKIVGQTSGAIAFVKDLRLISDNYGDLFGSYFIRDPHTNPAPNPRILTGKKTFTLSSSSSNEKPLPGSKLFSTGQGSFSAIGTLLTRQIQTTVTTTIETTIRRTTRRTTTVTATRREVVRARRSDPLAQSFVVGRDIDAPDLNGFSSDDKGVVLTEVDLFFANKPSSNEPLEVQVRTVELGIPTLNLVGESKTIYPDQITTSTNGETATKVTFPQPIYLAPGNEYAIVLLAPTTDQYEVWIAKMGERTVNTQSLPDAEAVIYTKQFALGSLFKSQNGSIWTPTQELDLKFKLYKAKFTSTTGIAHFGNPPLDRGNGYVNRLLSNPVTSLPKTTTLRVTTFTDSGLIDILDTGRKISGAQSYTYGYISYSGGPVSSEDITAGGTNYTNQSNLATSNIVGNGQGLRFDITTTNGSITGLTKTANGTGYQIGDVVTVNSGTTGRNALITITAINGRDTLYLTNVQGESGVNGFNINDNLVYYDTDSTTVSLGSTNILSVTEGSGLNSGNILEVSHFDHGMYANNNKLELTGVNSNIAPTTLTAPLTVSETATIFVGDSSDFETFEGVAVSATNPGYAKIGDEIISYESATGNELRTLSRSIEGKAQSHEINSKVEKYEFNGVSLRRINGVVHDIYDTGIDSSGYYIEIDRSSNGTDRSNDASLASSPQLSFTGFLNGGGDSVYASENIQFNAVLPRFNIVAPGDTTSVSAVIRTTSGTSIDGTETSFNLLNEVEPVELNSFNNLKSTRIVCSRINELQQPTFENVSGRRSFTTAITLNTTDENLSPIINLDESTVQFASNYLNRPVTDFVADSRSNSILNDPHAATYVSNQVNLSQPASSLKVLLSAYRHPSADIRVLYSLVRQDSAEIEQSFELFPGYENIEATSDGSFRVVDESLNTGHPDTKVPASLDGQFLEYEFNANDLGEFTGYSIKIVMSGTDQANPPIISDLRTIALA